MFKRIVILILSLMYLYTLAFDIFLNQYFRIPTPLLFCYPLIFLFGSLKQQGFLYGKEVFILFLSVFLYYFVQGDTKGFWVNIITIISCCLYFNYFIGLNQKRLITSVYIFMGFLFLSAVVMVLNHMNGSSIDALRVKMIGGPIKQSPTGISTSIFSFGYQLAALTAFLFIYALKFRFKPLLKVGVFILCLIFIFLGLQRSVIVTFLSAVLLFSIFYYRSRLIYFLAILSIVSVLFTSFLSFENPLSKYDNVLAKNERNKEAGEDRSRLMTENLKIFSNYPYGLLFYGKNWKEVTKGSLVFRNGLTSHNAYLMFITYLGPFIGLGLLIPLYYGILKAFKDVIKDIKGTNFGLLTCLCFAFLAVSLNCMFHNAWIMNANGPTIFLFFSVLHSHTLANLEAE